MGILRKLLNFCIAAFLCYCMYVSTNMFINNNSNRFDLDYFIRDYTEICGNIELKYQSNGRSSSSYFFVLNNQEIRVSARDYHFYQSGNYVCIINQYPEPNGYAFLGNMTMIVILVSLIIKLLIVIYIKNGSR